MSQTYTLYGAPISFYTGKLKAYLINKGLAFDEVFSSLSVYKKVIVPETGVRFIPVLKTPDNEYLQDTSAIIDELEKRHTDNAMLPVTPKQRLFCAMMELWADEWLLIPAMHYRWNKDNQPYIYEQFGRVVAPWAPAFIRRFVGKKVGARFKGFLPVLGVKERTIPAIERWYEDHVLALLEQHFSQYDYVLGQSPSLADVALMGPLYAHLGLDPAPARMMQEKAPSVYAWTRRMQTKPSGYGNWIANDDIPVTLLPLIQRMFAESWPVFTHTVVELEEWALKYPTQQDIPRSIGEHEFTIDGVTDKRAILTFHQWKLQRVLDTYQRMTEEDRSAVMPLLRAVNGEEAMAFPIHRRVTRKNNKLVFDKAGPKTMEQAS